MDNNEEFLAHYGVARRSGRYPWGSGDNPYQRHADFLANYYNLVNNNFNIITKPYGNIK